MSIDDEIKALRDKHPDLLKQFSDDQIASEGFLQIPDSAMKEYATIKSSYLQLPKDIQSQIQSVQRAKATLSPSVPPKKPPTPQPPEPPPELAAPREPKPKTDYNLNDYVPPPVYSPGYANVTAKALDTINRASRREEGISPNDVEAALKIVFNDQPGVNRSNFLMTEEKAEDIFETPIWMSLLGILEPFDYPRGLSWAGLAYLGEYLPDTDTWMGQQLQDAAGYAGGLATDLAAAGTPFGGLGMAVIEDVGFGEVAGRNLYEAASSGALSKAVTRFHGDGIPFVDTGYRLPNLTGPNVLDIVLPKEEMAKFRDKAKAQGATEAQINFYDKLATSDVYRTIAGIIPEFAVDPLWFAGPAKGGQVIQKGGKAIRVSSVLGEASQAVARATNTKVDDVMRVGIDVVDGEAQALDTYRDAANALEVSVQAKNREADALIVASKASPENQVRVATEELTKQITEVGETAQPIREVLTQAIADAADPAAKEAAERALQVFDQKMVRVVDELAKTQATLGMERDFATNAERYLKNRAKALRGSAARDNADAEAINRFIQIAESSGGELGRQAVVNRGLNFHIPLTKTQFGVSLPFVGKQKGLRLRPRPGDTAASISNWVGVNIPDLAKLNNTTIEGLEEMIRNGERIVFQIGNKPSHLGKSAALSLAPEGVVAAYLKGLTPAPLAENLGDFSRYFSGNNYQRILDLESKGLPLTYRDELAKFLYEQIGSRLTSGADKFLQLFATRFTQPLMASESLARALRYFGNRDVRMIRNMQNARENAIIRLKTVAPDLWNAYQDATTTYLRKVTADGDRITAFMNRMMRQANEIAAVRRAAGQSSDGDQVMQEVMNAIESGQGRQLADEERDIADAIIVEMKRIGDENSVEREAVRQSLMAMARWVQTDPKTIAEVIEDVRHLELLLKEAVDRGIKTTKQVSDELREKINTLKSIYKRGMTDEGKRFRQELVDKLTIAKNELVEANKRLRKGQLDKPLIDGAPSDISAKALQDIQARISDISEQLAKKGEAPDAPKIVAPGFKMPKGKSTDTYMRPLLNWETELFTEYRAIIDNVNAKRRAKGLEDLSQETELRVVMSMFQDAPNALKRPEAFREVNTRYVTGTDPQNARVNVLPREKGEALEELNQQIDQILIKTPAERTPDDKATLKALRAQQDQLYFEQWQMSGGFVPQAVGERFGAIPEDIKDMTQAMSEMFAKYEDLYKQYGRDFTKDPFERMKLWGVVGYVPHMRKDFVNPIRQQESINAFSKGNLDRELSLNLDQAKKRSIAGLLAEINALPKGNTTENWAFSVDPNLLIAHFVSGSRSLSNQDYLVSMLKGGVIRTFETIDDAARQQYIPLFDHGEYARDMQILLLGSSGEISTLIRGTTGEGVSYLNKFRDALNTAIKNKMRIGEQQRPLKTWVDDISQIRETDTVEQALAGINVHASLRGEDTFNVVTRHQELVDIAMTERRTKLENLLVKKNELLRKASKEDDIAKYQQQIVGLQNKLIETSQEFANAKQKAERQAWQRVSEEVNQLVARANNETNLDYQVVSLEGRLPNISSKSLSMYMAKDQEMFRLYIPSTVQESMSRTFEYVQPTGAVKTAKGIIDKVNNLWKSRITVLSLAFTARNWVGNLFSNALNIGVGGAMDLSTNYKACLLGSLVDYHAKYGSVDNALNALARPDQFKRAFLIDKGTDTKFMRMRESADLAALLRGLGVKDGQGLVELGDGVMRPLDDVLADLTNRGVISGQSTYRVDSDEIAYQYQKLAAQMGIKERTGKVIDTKWSTAKTWLSTAEDTIYVGLPFIMGAPFVGVPKSLGQTIARRTENQGRLVNYIANIKQGKTSDQATEMVNKFLFDYSDLTNTQKTWMRTLFPFFTWNQKNILLHMELMLTNPTYYSQMYRFFYGALPDISAAQEREAAAEQDRDIGKVDARDLAAQKVITGPKYRAFRVAVDVDPTNNIVIQGFGLPIEGFAQNVGTANDIMNNMFTSFGNLAGLTKSKGSPSEAVKGLGSFGSQTNVVLRAPIELLFEYDLFRQESITEGDYDYKKTYMLANDMGNLVQVLTQYSNPSVKPTEIETASSQGTGHMIAQYIIDALDMVAVHDPNSGKLHWYIQNPDKLKVLRAMRMLPHERLLREAATAIDLNQTMYMTPEVYESGQATKFLDHNQALYARFLSAYSGVKVKQDTDLVVQQQIFEENVKQLMIDYHSSMLPGAKR